MSQQYVYGKASDKYKKRLFVDNGVQYQEVKARIIEPYGSPVPQTSVKELKIINAPSHIQSFTPSSYKVTIVLLFESKPAYSEYMPFVGFGHKFYDEKGSIYMGAVESIKSTPVEANKRYKVELSLALVKKDMYDYERRDAHEFQDLYVDDGSVDPDKVAEMARLGIVDTYDKMGNPILYFYPRDICTRAELASMLMRTKRVIERMVRA